MSVDETFSTVLRIDEEALMARERSQQQQERSARKDDEAIVAELVRCPFFTYLRRIVRRHGRAALGFRSKGGGLSLAFFQRDSARSADTR